MKKIISLLFCFLFIIEANAAYNNAVNNFLNVDVSTQNALRSNLAIPFQPLTDTTTARNIGTSDANTFINFTNNTAPISAYLQTDAAAPVSADSQILLFNQSTSQTLALTPGDGVTVISPTNNNSGAGGGAMVGPGGFILVKKLTTTNKWQILQVYDYYQSSGNTWSGIWAASQAGEFTVERNNGMVTVRLPEVEAIATTSSIISSSQYIPARFFSNATLNYFSLPVFDSGTVKSGAIIVGPSYFTVGLSNSVSFSGSGSSGTLQVTLNYFS